MLWVFPSANVFVPIFYYVLLSKWYLCNLESPLYKDTLCQVQSLLIPLVHKTKLEKLRVYRFTDRRTYTDGDIEL